MVVFLVCDQAERVVLVQTTSQSDVGIASLRTYVRPGGQFLGYGYDELMQLGSGRQELEDRTASPPPKASQRPAEHPRH